VPADRSAARRMGGRLARLARQAGRSKAADRGRPLGEREVPWVAITPVVNAIRVLERMVPDGHLLFDHHAHDLQFARQGTGTLKKSGLRTRIEDFVTWANREAARHGLAWPARTSPTTRTGRSAWAGSAGA